MRRAALSFAVFWALLASCGHASLPDEKPIHCSRCNGWNEKSAPFHVFGNTAYVGVAGLSSVLVTTSNGLVLLDGGLPQSASRIAANIAALGHSMSEVKVILTSHAHYDHVGGVAALARRSGARVVASASTAEALSLGHPTSDDPQVGYDQHFPIVKADVVRDGEAVTVGDVAFTAHAVPGHTPGATTWTWKSCEGERCVDVVYADSLNAISDETFRYTNEPARVEAFRRSIDTVAALPCDILVSVHPELSALDERHAKKDFIDPTACRRYADVARKKLDERVAEEAAHPTK